MNIRNLILLTVLLLVVIQPASAATVGVSPGFIDYGDVEKGDSQEITFYITTNIEEEFELNPEYSPSTKFVDNGNGISMENVSEQDISNWISFSQNTYTIDPSTSETYRLPDGSSVNAEGSISMEVDIPPNAEPGYKIGEIELNPSITGEGDGAGARVFGQTVPGFAFRVPGTVNRDISISDIQAVRIGEDQVQIIYQLRNTGTVTTRFTGGKATVRGNSQNLGRINIGPATLTPGEYAEVDSTWRSDRVEGGEYEIEGSGDYSTGETYISGQFVIQDVIQERQSVDEPSGGVVEEQKNTPLTMIAIISLLIGTLLYILDIKFTWIAMIVGSTTISLYILLSSAANALVLIPLLSILVLWYI